MSLALKTLSQRIAGYSSVLKEALSLEGGSSQEVISREITRGLQELRQMKKPSVPPCYQSGFFNLAYDATPLMVPRILGAFLNQPKPFAMQHVVLRFPSCLKESASVWGQILSPWFWQIQVTCNVDSIQELAGPKSSLLMMGSDKIRKAALEWSKLYGKVIFAGPTGMQKIIIEDSVQEKEYRDIARFIVDRTFRNAGAYCMNSRELVLAERHVQKGFVSRFQEAWNDWSKLDLMGRLPADKQVHFDKQVDKFVQRYPSAQRLPFTQTLPHSSRPMVFLSEKTDQTREVSQQQGLESLEPFGPFLHILVVESVDQKVLDKQLNWSGNVLMHKFTGNKTFPLRYPNVAVQIENPSHFTFSDPKWKVGGPLTQHFVSRNGVISNAPFCMMTELYQ